MSSPKTSVDLQLLTASEGFACIFNDDLEKATKTFNEGSSPFHQMGLGVIYFLQAALGLEDDLMPEAQKYLTLAEAGAREQAKLTKSGRSSYVERSTERFPIGLEWDILQADSTVLLGLTHALGESYTGFARCLWALNSAHSSFHKIFETVFPNGLDSYATPAMSRNPSQLHLPLSSLPLSLSQRDGTPATLSSAASTTSRSSTNSSNSISPSTDGARRTSSDWLSPITPTSPSPPFSISPPVLRGKAVAKKPSGIFSWFGNSLPVANGNGNGGARVSPRIDPDGPVEGMILSGAAFGYGLFNLILSLLPQKVRSTISFLGYKSDRALALTSLAVSANGNDVHSEFAAVRLISDDGWSIILLTTHTYLLQLALMTYNGIVLLTAGFQADEERVIKQYDAMLNRVESKYPYGSLWVLNRAKLDCYKGRNERAIEMLQNGLGPSRPIHFRQADAMLAFELAWILHAERRYEEAGEMFLKMQEVNHWSHPTYSYLAAGCYISLRTAEGRSKARVQMDRLPGLLERKKIGGKDLPTEVFIRHKLAFYRKKQEMRGGSPDAYMDGIFISPADELGFIWNNFERFTKDHAEAHIRELLPLTPRITLPSPYLDDVWENTPNSDKSSQPDLLLYDEFASRDLLLGLLHRAAGHFAEARAFFESIIRRSYQTVGKWLITVAHCELAVLELKVVSGNSKPVDLANGDSTADFDAVLAQTKWKKATDEAIRHLDLAAKGAANSHMGSRLDSRIAFLRDEIDAKKKILGLV